MAEQLPDVADFAPITIATGDTLDQRQTIAATLRATTSLTIKQIAEQAGYSGHAACSHFLRSDRGKAGVEAAVTLHLTEAGRIGLQAMIKLAKGARSENVRQMASADLMDRAGLRIEGERDPQAGKAAPVININVGGATSEPVTIDAKAQPQETFAERDTGGVGQKGGPGPSSNPTTPDKMQPENIAGLLALGGAGDE